MNTTKRYCRECKQQTITVIMKDKSVRCADCGVSKPAIDEKMNIAKRQTIVFLFLASLTGSIFLIMLVAKIVG